MLFKSEVSLLRPKALSPKSAPFSLKRDIDRRWAGTKDLSAPDQGLSLTHKKDGLLLLQAVTSRCQHSAPAPPGDADRPGEEGLPLDWV